MERTSFDIVIVGGGAAGLRAAIAAAETDPDLTIGLVSKVYPMRSHTVSAEGGTAAVLRDYDSFDLHALDTIKGSDFLADQDAVEFFVAHCPEEVVRLDHWGCPWSRDEDGRVSQRAFGGMSAKRTVFAADKVGFHILHTLFQTSMKYASIQRFDESFVTTLIVDGGSCAGVVAMDLRAGTMRSITAKATILATGGCGRVYEFTTNGFIKTGDGMALAYRAGVPLKDMEMVQFHPTCLPGTGILITEAARGEGGYLINKDGERYMQRYLPGKMELGPRDILSRAMIQEMEAGRAFEGPHGKYLGLDLRHLGERKIKERIPMVRELAEKYMGLDPVREPIPVRPGQHYMMGGVAANLKGETTLPGLFAVGETACVSINGANRLGSNSLSECLVFGASCGMAAAAFAKKKVSFPRVAVGRDALRKEEARVFDGLLGRERGKESVAGIRVEMQRLMDRNVGIFRTEAGLAEACGMLAKLRDRFGAVGLADKDRVFNTELTGVLELDFMLDVATAIAYTALNRKESRGAHSRTDFPQRDDANFLKHSMTFRTEGAPRIDYAPVTITKWQPTERKY
ncbi:MAG TPA: succinate dehydrogenase/fumarate reductase flavoprotein subunit [Thermoplasmata archaeon]|nr:succinate dehydrogenase/fumarate reductase flavoprotein subunit [Thermoplasmata archaeon]